MPASSAAVLAAALAATAPVRERERNGLPHLRSESVLVRYADTEEVVLSKNPREIRPIASVTKLLSGLVLSRQSPPAGDLSGGRPRGASTDASVAAEPEPEPELARGWTRGEGPALEWVEITEEDKDRLKWSRSRLRIGLELDAGALFDAALAASDNRAMYAVVRARGHSRATFVEQMNALARELGMARSTFRDPAGIDPGNVSTAEDLLLLISAAAGDERIRAATGLGSVTLVDRQTRALTLYNPNRLVRSSTWDVVVGKTGYTVEAGRALVLRARIDDRPVDMVFLGAREMASVFGDAGRVRRWLVERASPPPKGGAALGSGTRTSSATAP